MSLIISRITAAQKDRILTLEEGHFQDLKAIDIAPAKLTRSISAFSNASGGELYVGIDEKTVAGTKVREWRGFADQEAANAHIQVFEQLFPLGQFYSYTFLEEPSSSGLVLQVQINKTREITKASDGNPYIRRGAQNLPVTTAEALQRLRFDKGVESFESATVDVDPKSISNSTHIIEFLINVVPTAEPDEWLRKQLLLRDSKPTVAGVLLFAEEPQAILPKRCAIKIYRYRTSQAEGTRDTLAFDPPSEEFDFALESFDVTGDVTTASHDFERDGAVVLFVLGEVDGGHAARADFALDNEARSEGLEDGGR